METRDLSYICLLLILVIVSACSKAGTEKEPVLSIESKDYLSTDARVCAKMNIKCENGTFFLDETGCGCMPIDEESASAQNQEKNRCQKRDVACTKEYLPVCGWFDKEKIKCIKYPCAGEYGNSCMACNDKSVEYWTKGRCPQG